MYSSFLGVLAIIENRGEGDRCIYHVLSGILDVLAI